MERHDRAHTADVLWNGLVMAPSQPRRPGLRMEVAAGQRMLLHQGGRHILFASVDGDHGGVSLFRTGRYRSPIPHLRAAHARNVADGDSASWTSRWAYYFADRLTEEPGGPLHDGTWMLTPHVDGLKRDSPSHNPAQRWQQIIAAGDPDGYLDWFTRSGCWGVVPLNKLPEPDDGRVKSYRKQLRDGILPPVLLWWISGLDCYVLLDGHHRLIAALAEDQEPALLALNHLGDPTVVMDLQISRYSSTLQHLLPLATAGVPGIDETVARAGITLADSLLRLQRTSGRTRAWPLPGGETAWRAAVHADAPAWLTETDRLN